MRDLHVIGVSDDGAHLLLAAHPDAARATHRVAADDRLRTAIRGDLPPPGRTPAESALTPKEIQARLRAGDTPEQVARAAGVPVVRVLRYAGPVLSERQLMVDAAQAAVMTRPRRGQSTLNLGESVQTHLSSMAGLRADSLSWQARRREDGGWVVALSFTARGRGRTAQWLWEPPSRTVSPLDQTAALLGHVAADGATESRTVRRAAPARAKRAAATKTATRRRPSRPAGARATTRRVTAPAKAARPAKRSGGSRATPTKKTPTKKTPTRKTRTVKVTARRSTALPATKRGGRGKRVPAAGRGRAAPAQKPSARQAKKAVPTKRATALPPPSRSTRSTGRRGGTGRSTVPSWSDVLLGVQRPAAGKRTVRRSG